ncbi:patatin-like phospholipase domain-containing protein 2 isoform X2 [Chrysoperla carnea]|uniref:patatin-like phospholipase domain-containing protein 2 isoform X2 n=1 Tax=Chrysoperla carnea TaxID=189513 RepID=UPI001D08B91E|nr:patatin-like phospholipase domain-containing protein 2 isoform X2 [Chrysoperla carnea]
MNLSFAGCGFLGIYHVGVACCFRQYAPQLLLDKISGASAGALAACCLLCDLPLGDMTSDVLRIACEARTSVLGPFRPSFNIQNALLEGIDAILPDDAHIRVSGKLHISLTRVYDGKNVIVSQFDSREDLMQALLASAFVPVFSGLIPPKFKGVRYMDGGFSDNLPTLDENTITVSPFCGESDICPRDDSSQLFHINVANTSIELSKQNIYRFARILFPPRPEVLSNMCKQGFDDALRFLHRNNLISCTRCLSIQSTFVVSETLDESYEYDPQCKECKLHRQQALLGNMPDTVLSIFQDAIESANKGLVNWVFRHRGMKILSVLTLPYTLPVDIAYATYSKLTSNRKAYVSQLTETSFTNIIGNAFETRSFQFRTVGSVSIQCEKKRHINQYLAHEKQRLVTAAPKMKTNVWDISSYILEQLAAIMNRNSYRHEKHNSKINCKLAITQYNGNTGENIPDLQNKVNLDFTVNLDNNDFCQSPINKVLSRSPSVVMNKVEIGEDDTFDTILQVTAQHEAIMAYYYTDENNKVNWTEIYDMTNAECEALHSEHEKELNTQLEYDDDWNDNATWMSQNAIDDKEYYYEDDNSLAGVSDISLEEIIERESANIFSDPESEWNASSSVKVTIPEDINLPDLRPESDQPSVLSTTTSTSHYKSCFTDI